MPTRSSIAGLIVYILLIGTTRAAFSQAPEPAATRPPSFKSLVTPLAGDFTRLAARGNLTLLAVGTTAAAASHSWDTRLAESGWGQGGVHTALAPGRVVGNMLTQTGAAFATYAIGRAAGKPRVATVGAELFRAQIVAQGATQAIKFVTRRTRPDGTSLSFPSGHAAAAYATATVLQSNLGWKVGVPAFAAASWVAASRVQSDRHYLSDVIAGATVGILAGRSVTIGHGNARFALSPTAMPGGIGISVTKVGR